MEGWPCILVGKEEMWIVTLEGKGPLYINPVAGTVSEAREKKQFRVIAKTKDDAISKVRFLFKNKIESIEPGDQSLPLII